MNFNEQTCPNCAGNLKVDFECVKKKGPFVAWYIIEKIISKDKAEQFVRSMKNGVQGIALEVT